MPRFFRRLAEGVFDEDDVRRRADELADFVDAAREAYGLAAPIAVGFSNGANIAAAVLQLRPDVLAGAVLLARHGPVARATRCEPVRQAGPHRLGRHGSHRAGRQRGPARGVPQGGGWKRAPRGASDRPRVDAGRHRSRARLDRALERSPVNRSFPRTKVLRPRDVLTTPCYPAALASMGPRSRRPGCRRTCRPSTGTGRRGPGSPGSRTRSRPPCRRGP